jgi:hypothetical protein
MGNQREARRGARIAASFWVGVEGVDLRPVLRRGNISATGLYVESDHALGPTGSVQFLHLESEDHRVVVQVLARIIRVTQSDDLVHGQLVGTAIEFMPSSLEGRHHLERLVRHVVELGLAHDESVEHGFEVGVNGHTTERTSLQRLSVQRVVLETEWQPQIGDRLRFDIRAQSANEAVPLEGQVTAVDPTEYGFRVAVRITGLASTRADTEPELVDPAVTGLIAGPFDDFVLPPRDSLAGELRRIKLPTLLGLFEMERMSGELLVSRVAGDACTLFVHEGRLVDVERAGASAPARELLAEILEWDEGEFHFTVEDVQRDDRVGASITSLLLDLAREADEASADRPVEDGDDII